jgi:hypothetical protein
MQKTCSKCGVQFSCQNEMPGCWCERVQLNQETLDELKATYENCLCPVCLQGFANRDAKNFGASSNAAAMT